VAAKQVSGGEPATAGRRRGGGRLLRVHGAVVSSGGGRCSDGGALRWPEVVLNGKAALATEGGGRLGAPTVPCEEQWLSDRLGVAQRCTKVHESGVRWPALDAWSKGGRREAEWVGARRLLREEDRTSFSFGPIARGEDARSGGCMRCVWSGRGGQSIALVRGGGCGRAAVTRARRQRLDAF
jgi:hypothetical protein